MPVPAACFPAILCYFFFEQAPSRHACTFCKILCCKKLPLLFFLLQTLLMEGRTGYYFVQHAVLWFAIYGGGRLGFD